MQNLNLIYSDKLKSLEFNKLLVSANNLSDL